MLSPILPVNFEFICFNNGLGVTIESVDGKHKRHVQYPDQIQINFE